MEDAPPDHPYFRVIGVAEAVAAAPDERDAPPADPAFNARVDRDGGLYVMLAGPDPSYYQIAGAHGAAPEPDGRDTAGRVCIVGAGPRAAGVERRSSDDRRVALHYPDPDAKLREIWIATGHDTACVVHAATGHPVVCALEAANRPSAAGFAARIYGNHRPVILADIGTDAEGSGTPAAASVSQFARAINAIVATPVGPARPGGGPVTFASSALRMARDEGRGWPFAMRAVRGRIELEIGDALSRHPRGRRIGGRPRTGHEPYLQARDRALGRTGAVRR